MKNVFGLIREKFFRQGRQGGTASFGVLFEKFQETLALNNQVMELITRAGDTLSGDYVFDRRYIHTCCAEIRDLVQKLVFNLDWIAPNKYQELHEVYHLIASRIEADLAGHPSCPVPNFVLPYSAVNRNLAEAVGGKNASLAEISTYLGLKCPQGFAITTAAYFEFLRINDLPPKIKESVAAWQQGRITVDQAADKIRALIMAGRLPTKLEKELANALEGLAGAGKVKKLFLAVRSSAWGEDGERTFAGQYLSLLNVAAVDLAQHYRRVVAALYSSKAMLYRQSIGFNEDEVAMAVACQEMVDGMVSGVLYTMDPSYPEHDNMLLTATWGLGAPVVSGMTNADRFSVERRSSHKITSVNLVHKEMALQLKAGGGTENRPVDDDLQTMACLRNNQVQQVAEAGLRIEKYFKGPQDIEFTFNSAGELVILQTRRLAVQARSDHKPLDLVALGKIYPIILHNQGEVGQKGVGAGPVFLLRRNQDLADFPAGAILVARYASPLLAKVLPLAAGIITDVGATTGHLATVAREFRIPCLLNTGNATELLSPGLEVTMDTEENIVFEGIVKELQAGNLMEDDIADTSEYRLLRRVLRKIEPLNLLDPAEKNFVPSACRTFHDIVRFVHEKAVEELIDRNYYHNHDPATFAGKLTWNIPIDLVMIDIGGGLRDDVAGRKIRPEQITSTPMQALLAGLAHPKAWDNDPMSLDFGSFMSSLTRTFSPELATPKFVGQNLAVVSRDYANVSLRLGYHFTMIDTYMTENISNNYAYFRFFGGVTDVSRRSRRAKFLHKVLEDHDFRVEVHGDLVVARIKKVDEASLKKRLYLLGLLIGFTRQLDVKMVSNQSINDYVDKLNTLMRQANDR